MNGRDARFYNTLGLLFDKQEKRDAAIEAFQKANRLDARYVKSRYNLGTIFLDQQRYELAQAQFEEAIRIDPGYLRARVRLGDVLSARGDEAGAIREYTRAAQAGAEDEWGKAAQARLVKMGR